MAHPTGESRRNVDRHEQGEYGFPGQGNVEAEVSALLKLQQFPGLLLTLAIYQNMYVYDNKNTFTR